MIRRLAAVLSMLAFAACSDRSREGVGHAPDALGRVPGLVLGPPEAGWRLPPPGDFNGDGLQDVLWRDHTDNQFAVSLMSGTRLLEQGPMIPGPPGDDWIVASAAGDTNLDGMADIIWYNFTTNRMTVWLMRGTEPFERGPEIPGPPGDGWICAPALDFNFDGMADVLWYNPSTNRMTVWLMHGTEPFERGPEIPGPPGGGWLAAFGADFDRDGMADVFWYNPSSRRMAVWLMDGTTVRDRGPEIPTPESPGWILAAAGDFNHDLMADALWFDTRTRRMTTSLLAGTGLLEQGPEIPGPTGDGWIAGNSADCNGDGLWDVIWFRAHPLQMSIWLMNGTTPMVEGPVIPGPVSR